MLLEGLQLPLTTPFYPDGRLNLRKLEHNVACYSKTPVAGMAVLSQFGEAAMLSDEETRQVLRTAIDVAMAQKVMLAGISRDSVVGTLDLADEAAALDYDAVLVEPPSFLQTGSDAQQTKELLTYFQMIADRSALPVLLSSTSTSLSSDVVIELAGHSRIIGLVDSDGTPQRMAGLKAGTIGVKHEVTVTSVFAAVTGRMLAQQEPASEQAVLSADSLNTSGAAVAVAPSAAAIKTRTKAVGFQILTGRTAEMLDALSRGAVGAMPAFAACAPQACYEVFAAWKDGDRALAEEKQTRLQAVADRVESELGIAGIKVGCDLNGYFGGLPRLPRLSLDGLQRQEIETLMQGLRS
jgi:dihydrodipicolinate synthase/N-acetylneuraminate lyase